MLLEKVYDDFIKHTGLIDSVYKTVFINISSILTRIQSISWDYLKYSTETEETAYNFREIAKVPRYVIELLQNAFKNYYTLPTNTVIEIGVSVGSESFKVINSASGTQIPPELEFIDKYELYNMFILDKHIFDLFGSFDEEFKFTRAFQTNVKDIFHPLKKKFELADTAAYVSENDVSYNRIADTQFHVVTLQNKIQEILVDLDSLRKKTEMLIDSRNKIFTGVNSREALLLEKEKYGIEYTTLKTTKEGYDEKSIKLKTILADIDAELSDLTAKNASKELIDYLVRKKVTFENEKVSVEASLLDFNSFLSDLVTRMQDITTVLTQVDSYTTNDVESLDAQIKAAGERQDDLYGVLVGLETEMKHQKKIAEDMAIKNEKASSYGDITIQNIENSAIVSHLATSLNPSSVITVLNYLRYYFAYYATQIANDLLLAHPGLDVAIAHAVAVKLFLVRCFGLYFNQMFSAVDFADNRIVKVISIVKD
jgi:hypothetical protein